VSWNTAFTQINPHVVHIATPTGEGTGFLCLYNADKSLVGIATAAHVVNYAHEWQQPIRIIHPNSTTEVFLEAVDRYLYLDWSTDSAVIIFPIGKLQLPQQPLPLFPTQTAIDIGSDVAWIGFPNIAPPLLSCFFTGTISSHLNGRNAYFVDGVAINGVSGGPVIFSTDAGPQVVGIVSAYNANRATGETLPGLLVAQDVSHFHGIQLHIKSIDDANKNRQLIDSILKKATPQAAPPRQYMTNQ